MQSLKIVLFCIFAAICYGIVHDEITARICVEYFTVGHPDLFGTDSPTLLGVGWGIVATWWVGLILGLVLAFAAQFGRRPKRSLADLRRPILILLLIMAGFAALAGLAGIWIAPHLVMSPLLVLMEPAAEGLPRSKQAGFIIDSLIHIGSYASGFLGGIWLALLTWRSRRSNVLTQN